MATIANTTPSLAANLFEIIRRVFPRPAAPATNLRSTLCLIERRLLALQGSAPTWHPLHLQRVVHRSVVDPLRTALPMAKGLSAEHIRAALWQLHGIGDPAAALEVIDQAQLLLRHAARAIAR